MDNDDSVIRIIIADKTSRQLLFFLVLNVSFAVVELVYGLWANSLSLISDSFHMFFDSTALLAGLVASVISQWQANDLFSFGYVRAEILAGFVNGICLLFVAFFIFSEAVERVLDPPIVRQERLFAVSIVGLLVNILGIFVFHHGHTHEPGSSRHSCINRRHRQSSAGSKHNQMNTNDVPSVYDDSVTDPALSHRNISQVSSDHEYTYTEQVQSQRNVTFISSDQEPSYSDQERSQRNISRVFSDHEHSLNNDRARRNSDHSHGGLVNVPSNLRRTSSGQNHPTARAHTTESEDIFLLSTSYSTSEIIQGVYLHILADTLGSVGVIISSFLIYQFGWIISDPICSMFISALVVISVVPLLQESVSILMQRTPVALDRLLPRCYEKVSHIEGVYNIHQPHFWTLCTDVYVGALKLEVDASADSQHILTQTQRIFDQIGVKHLCVQIEQASTLLSDNNHND